MWSEMRLVAQLALGTIFGLSAAGKLRNPTGFAQGVVDYEILPPGLAYSVGLLLVPLEGFLAASHLTGWLLALAVPLGLGTLVTFGVAVGINLGRGRELPCHCFAGQGGETISGTTLARILLLVPGEALLFEDRGALASNRPVYPWQIATLREFGLALFWTSFLLTAAMWFLSLSDLLNLAGRGKGVRPDGKD